jgi:indolepyruvate ferredoxin oxidoreductase
MTTDELVEHRSSFLTDYQDTALAARYRALVERARQADAKAEAHGRIERAVAENYARLLAVKDEYEVARLHTDGRFERQLAEEFDGVRRRVYHFAPPFLGGLDANGRPKKRAFGPWILPFLRGLARLKRLRGTLFDPFARNAERIAERRLIADYEADCRVLFSRARPADRDVAVELLSLPAGIRGFGPVKTQAMEKAARRREELLALMGEGARGVAKAEVPTPAE